MRLLYPSSLVMLALIILVAPAPIHAGQFEDGLSAVNQGNYAAALRLWKPLADQGNAAAQFNLGVMYNSGDGVPEDDVEAVKWYRKAADQGNAAAQFNLGVMYSSGEGVPEDLVQAYSWINLAAAKGYNKASEGKEILVKDMTSSQIEEAQRLSREWWAKHNQ